MPRPTSVVRVFLGWDEPLLARATGWLLARSATASGPPDLTRLLVVTPGRRAGRRLLEHLAVASSARGGLLPPVLATPGTLAELLFLPRARLAGRLESRLLRAEALRRADPEVVARLLADPPGADDLTGWLDLAAELERVEEELAVEDLDVATARGKLETVALAAGVEASEGARWAALQELSRAAADRLVAAGREGAQAFRLSAAAGRVERSGLDVDSVVLIGLSEMPRLFRRLLEARSLPVTALVMAPESEAEAFDPWGAPRDEVWPERHVELEAASVVVADRPVDQTGVAVERVLAWGDRGAAGAVQCRERKGCGGPGRGPITVGVADPRMAATLVDQLARLGVGAHAPETRALGSSVPAHALETLGRYVAGRRLTDLVALVRIPPVERWIARRLAAETGQPVERSLDGPRRRSPLARQIEAENWLAALDRFAADCAGDRIDRSLGGEVAGRELVRRLDAAALALLEPEPGGGARATLRARRAPSRWAPAIAMVLERLFESETEEPAPLGPTSARGPAPTEGPASTLEALAALGELLRECATLAEQHAPVLDLEEMVSLLVSSLGDRSPGDAAPVSGSSVEAAVGEPVEVLGWLELALDDAPDLVVVGMNEGVVPAAIPLEPFLSEGVRRALGLLDDRRRTSRDLFLLGTLVHSRERLVLVAGRRTAEGDPLSPSRLLLARPAEDLAPAVARFFEAVPRSAVASALSAWAETSAFPVPRPQAATPLEGLTVTAFRDYLACPYRFYLRHVVGLEAVREPARELDAASFGRLAHAVLQRFALGPVADSDDTETISAALRDELAQVAHEQLGAAPVAAARVQVAQLRRRLEVFAAWQAASRRRGWRIRHVELRLEGALVVDGAPFRIRGQLDRVDVDEAGRWRILDFKTGDAPRTPEQAHRRGRRREQGRAEGREDGRAEKEWIDLQLPLYRLLALEAGLARDGDAGDPVAGDPVLAFFALSKKLSAEGYAEAEWSHADLAAAEERAREAVRSIRAGIFWPPSEPPAWDDGYGWIAGDTLADRAALLAARAQDRRNGEPERPEGDR